MRYILKRIGKKMVNFEAEIMVHMEKQEQRYHGSSL